MLANLGTVGLVYHMCVTSCHILPHFFFFKSKCPPDCFVLLNEKMDILQSVIFPHATIGKKLSGSSLDLQSLKVWCFFKVGTGATCTT